MPMCAHDRYVARSSGRRAVKAAEDMFSVVSDWGNNAISKGDSAEARLDTTISNACGCEDWIWGSAKSPLPYHCRHRRPTLNHSPRSTSWVCRVYMGGAEDELDTCDRARPWRQFQGESRPAASAPLRIQSLAARALAPSVDHVRVCRPLPSPPSPLPVRPPAEQARTHRVAVRPATPAPPAVPRPCADPFRALSAPRRAFDSHNNDGLADASSTQ